MTSARPGPTRPVPSLTAPTLTFSNTNAIRKTSNGRSSRPRQERHPNHANAATVIGPRCPATTTRPNTPISCGHSRHGRHIATRQSNPTNHDPVNTPTNTATYTPTTKATTTTRLPPGNHRNPPDTQPPRAAVTSLLVSPAHHPVDSPAHPGPKPVTPTTHPQPPATNNTPTPARAPTPSDSPGRARSHPSTGHDTRRGAGRDTANSKQKAITGTALSSTARRGDCASAARAGPPRCRRAGGRTAAASRVHSIRRPRPVPPVGRR